MTAKDAIRTAMELSQGVLRMFLNDMADADLLVRPDPGANHPAWQLGHIITIETRATRLLGGTPAELPPGFEAKHAAESAKADPPAGFLSRNEYLSLFETARSGLLSALEKMSDADLDKPNTGAMARIAPTLGALFLLTTHHVFLHLGQFSVVRRKLGKPVLF